MSTWTTALPGVMDTMVTASSWTDAARAKLARSDSCRASSSSTDRAKVTCAVRTCRVAVGAGAGSNVRVGAGVVVVVVEDVAGLPDGVSVACGALVGALVSMDGRGVSEGFGLSEMVGSGIGVRGACV